MSSPIERAVTLAHYLRQQQSAKQNTTFSTVALDTVENPISSRSLEYSGHTLLPHRKFPKPQAHANNLSERYKVPTWMAIQAAENRKIHVVSKCVNKFLRFFSGSIKAILYKARWRWRKRAVRMSFEHPWSRSGTFTHVTW